jgi:hypothetical protein
MLSMDIVPPEQRAGALAIIARNARRRLGS